MGLEIAFTLLEDIFVGTTFVGSDWIMQLVFLFGTLAILSRNVSDWKVLAFPVVTGWTLVGMQFNWIFFAVSSIVFVIEGLSMKAIEGAIGTIGNAIGTGFELATDEKIRKKLRNKALNRRERLQEYDLRAETFENEMKTRKLNKLMGAEKGLTDAEMNKLYFKEKQEARRFKGMVKAKEDLDQYRREMYGESSVEDKMNEAKLKKFLGSGSAEIAEKQLRNIGMTRLYRDYEGRPDIKSSIMRNRMREGLYDKSSLPTEGYNYLRLGKKSNVNDKVRRVMNGLNKRKVGTDVLSRRADIREGQIATARRKISAFKAGFKQPRKQQEQRKGFRGFNYPWGRKKQKNVYWRDE